jgi:S-methylmethionine-dependent homocysteine/selenocysteine methylase
MLAGRAVEPRILRPVTRPLTLTDAGMETALIFHQGIDLPGFAAFPLVDTEDGREALRRYYRPYLDLARDRETPFVLDAPTWRANPDWGAELGFDAAALAAVNRRSVAFIEEVRREARPAGGPAVQLEALVGPRGDGYVPGAMMAAEEAEAYHAVQLRALADTAVDLVAAMTITDADEATGIVRAARSVGLPITIGFTLETDGRLPSGQALGDAIVEVDRETDGGASQFMINCAHPAHFAGVLAAGGDWRDRIGGLRANASTLSHAELDAAEELDDGDPADLAARYVAVRELLPNLSLIGGCCGTDIRHVTAICEAWLAEDRSTTLPPR